MPDKKKYLIDIYLETIKHYIFWSALYVEERTKGHALQCLL